MDVEEQFTMKTLLEYVEEIDSLPIVGDNFDIELTEDECILSTHIVEILEDGIVIECDDVFAREYAELLEETLTEAEYQGRTVKLGKPMAGDVKKYKVYVKDPKSGNVKKVNFGDKKLSIKRDNPGRRKNFRARHNCAQKKDRTTAG